MPESTGTKIKELFFIKHIRNWYAKFERPISSISLIGGFVFDALTLKRIDLFWENFWVIAHLLIVGICIIWVHVGENKHIDEKDPARIHFWLVNILQFFFGGLLSTFLVYYFRSGTLAVSWPFLLILAAAFVANEALKKHYTRLAFQISLFYLSLFCFAIFIVPVLLHSIGPWIFFLSGLASLVALFLFLSILRFFAKDKLWQNKWPLIGVIAIIFIGVNILYFYNLIPPLPLSLQEAGIYHSLTPIGPGLYTVQEENNGTFSFLQYFSPTINIVPGDSLYAYSAVFSPASFNTKIIHEWQHYDEPSHSWVTTAKITLAVVGGREGGYRTYSKAAPSSGGSWRVNVVTLNGAIIGRIAFNVTLQTTEPSLQIKQIQ